VAEGGVIERSSKMPTVKEFKDTLTTAKFNPKRIRLLRVHYHAPNRTMSAKQLAKAVGYAGYQGVNLQYGKLGYAMGKALQHTPTETYDDGRPIWTWVLATGKYPDSGDWEWTLRPELAQALEELDWV
jgi:hypothetical protein